MTAIFCKNFIDFIHRYYDVEQQYQEYQEPQEDGQ